MKTAMLLLVALMGCYLISATEEPKGDEVPASELVASDLNTSAVDIPAHVEEFLEANPAIISETSSSDGIKSGQCECGVFNTVTPSDTDIPLMTQPAITITCNKAGEENCNRLCSALAEAAKGRGPQLLCTSVGHATKIKASVHSHICNSKMWAYTGLTSPNEICCHQHRVIDCKDQVESAPVNQL